MEKAEKLEKAREEIVKAFKEIREMLSKSVKNSS